MTKFRTRSGNPAANKIVSVNAAQGNKGIGSQQGTTRIIYDSILLADTTVNTVVTLFRDCRTRQFPLTNLTENKLQQGESITVQRVSFYIMQTVAATTSALSVEPLGYHQELHGLYASNYTLTIAQTKVLKNIPIFSTYAPFNPNAKFNAAYQLQTFAAGAPTSNFNSLMTPHDNFEMENNLVIPTDLEFQVDIQIPPINVSASFDYYLGMTIQGLGSLFAPKGNF